jgi:hypothetical protein
MVPKAEACKNHITSRHGTREPPLPHLLSMRCPAPVPLVSEGSLRAGGSPGAEGAEGPVAPGVEGPTAAPACEARRRLAARRAAWTLLERRGLREAFC